MSKITWADRTNQTSGDIAVTSTITAEIFNTLKEAVNSNLRLNSAGSNVGYYLRIVNDVIAENVSISSILEDLEGIGLATNIRSITNDGIQSLANIETGVLKITETAEPAYESGCSQIYAKSDNKLYVKTGDGVEHEIAFV